jgi:hypothetical protein
MRRQHVHRARQRLEDANVRFVLRGIAAPVLDRPDRRNRIDKLHQRLERILHAAFLGILEQDQRQVGGVGDRQEMRFRHFGAQIAAHADRIGREHQQGGRACFFRHARKARRLEAAVGVYA